MLALPGPGPTRGLSTGYPQNLFTSYPQAYPQQANRLIHKLSTGLRTSYPQNLSTSYPQATMLPGRRAAGRGLPGEGQPASQPTSQPAGRGAAGRGAAGRGPASQPGEGQPLGYLGHAARHDPFGLWQGAGGMGLAGFRSLRSICHPKIIGAGSRRGAHILRPRSYCYTIGTI